MGGTLLFGGTDLASLCTVEDLSDFWSSSDVRGDLDTSPGIDGAVTVARPVSSKMASGQITVGGSTLAQAEDAVAAVKALLRLNATQTVTRRKITGAGNLDATQSVIFRTAAERWLNDKDCTLLLGAELLDGLWHGPSTNIASGAGTHDILGDTRTYRMTVTLPAGPARYVVNNTNGHWLLFYAVVPSGGVVIDVEACTATAITGSVDMSEHLSWAEALPMRLEAGSNTLAVTDGTASIDYQPAYL